MLRATVHEYSVDTWEAAISQARGSGQAGDLRRIRRQAPTGAVQPDNQERADRRAKAEFRRIVMAGGFDTLLTLTYRENITNRRKAYEHLRSFYRAVQRAIPKWAYVAIPEPQQRGSIHWHIAVQGWQKVVLLRSIWRQVIAEDGLDGNIDVKGRGTWATPRLARYLAKYMSKDEALGREYGEHRYYRSEAVKVPTEVVTFPEGVTLTEVYQALESRQGAKIRYRKEFDYFAWCCSW